MFPPFYKNSGRLRSECGTVADVEISAHKKTGPSGPEIGESSKFEYVSAILEPPDSCNLTHGSSGRFLHFFNENNDMNS